MRHCLTAPGIGSGNRKNDKESKMTKVKRHGLSIGIERVGSEFFLYLQVTGKLTHDDYEIITPLLESALGAVAHPRVKALVDITDLEGWELRAAWDDLKLGLRHGKQFSRVAVLGDEKWQALATRVGNWFTAAELQYFESRGEALEWLAESEETSAVEDRAGA
ncbi:SpoIIAA-like [Microbulbifer yueqingensis]|uniref:SpoIIAA-like n=2 Tax=Microbulbifer yueqingensis TaxID=658219 RepID=A0A1G8Y1Q5_9GAMM|nr:SpoIIAA-like [Microbulbifer yueqingensis]